MAASNSKTVIYAALAGNALIAVTKFFASFITMSSAMMAEGIHSLVDTFNQLLLLYGLSRARRPADNLHPFGYGQELYFWAFIVAILIFAAGGGFSIYEGLHKLEQPTAINKPLVNYLVLAAAMIFEGIAWWIAFRTFKKDIKTFGLIKAIRNSKDPTVFTVLFEDSAAMLGLMIAAAGIACSHLLGWLWADGVASVVIGVVLIIVALALVIETKGLLIGEGASDQVLLTVKQIIAQQQNINGINEFRSLHFGPQDVLIVLSLDFADDIMASEVKAMVSRIEKMIKDCFPDVRRVYIEAQSRHDQAQSKTNREVKAEL